MCKCCQSLLESCYWHCCEKHFCWDDSIALYEDPDEKKCEYNNNGMDNMAFYDNVALIANRSIFTIEPLPPKDPVPVVTQPKKKLRWFEDEGEAPNKVNDRTSTIRRRKMSTVPEEDHDAISVDTIDGDEKSERGEVDEMAGEEPEGRVGATQETKENAASSVELSKAAEMVVELRRKKLLERRMSKGLTLTIDRERDEIPVIRHNSMPKFYLDTPEENQIHYTAVRTPSVTLTAPVKPKEFEFDLKSVVQIQREVTTPTENVRPKRTQSVKERILKRQSSNLSVNASSIAAIHM